MWLSELPESIGFQLMRDAEFESLGLLSTRSSKRMVYVETEDYALRAIEDDGVSCVVAHNDLNGLPFGRQGVVISKNPKATFYDIHTYLYTATEFYGQSQSSVIAPSASIHPTAVVAERNVTIGDRCVIGPHVVVHENTTIEDDVIVRAGSVIGTEGFGFYRMDGRVKPIPHAGGVIINHRVEIQANCCIARAMFGGNTEIGADTKMDNLVYIAHNVKIGERCLIAANAAITGSVTIGDDVWIGPTATIAHELTVGDGAAVSLGAIVTKSVGPGQRVSGNFAVNHERYLDFIRTIR